LLILLFYINFHVKNIYLNKSSFDKVLLIFSILIIILVIIDSIFIIINKKQKIIKDCGINKMLLFNLGIILFFIGELYHSYNNYIDCAINFALKHVGITIVLAIFYVYISLGYELGITNVIVERDEKFNIVNSTSIGSLKSITSDLNISGLSLNSSCLSLQSTSRNNESCSRINVENPLNSIPYVLNESNNKINVDSIRSYSKSNVNDHIYNASHENYNLPPFDIDNNIKTNYSSKKLILHDESYKNDILKSSSVDIYLNSSNNNINNNENNKNNARKVIKRNIRKAHSMFIEMILIYPLIIFVTLSIVIYYSYIDDKDEINIIQSYNGMWYYKCNLDNINLVYSTLEILMLILIIGKGKSVVMYECVFKITKFIVYSSILMIVLGPTVNVMYSLGYTLIFYIFTILVLIYIFY